MSGFLVVAGPVNKASELQSQGCFLNLISHERLSTLKCGGLESQIMSTDSLVKLDSVVEGILRRVERAVVEADKDATIEANPASESGTPLTFAGDERTFTVNSGGKWCSTTEYLQQFTWNPAYGTSSVQETAQEIQKLADAIDSHFRAETQKYTDKKNAWFLVSPPEAAGPYSFATKDLVDVLKPENVIQKDASKPHEGDDFIYTKNITTIVVVVPSGADDAFVAWHDGCADEESYPIFGQEVDRGWYRQGWRQLVPRAGDEGWPKRILEGLPRGWLGYI
jgi:hypothetical protein